MFFLLTICKVKLMIEWKPMLTFTTYKKWERAIRNHNIDQFKTLIQDNDILYERSDDYSLLEYCLESDGYYRSGELIKIVALHEKNLEKLFNFKLSTGNTLLEELFINSNYLEVITTLIHLGFIDLTWQYQKDDLITTYIYLAVLHNNFKLINEILIRQPKHLLTVDNKGNTFLPYAIIHADDRILNFLQQSGVNIHYSNEYNINQFESAMIFFSDNVKNFHFLKEKKRNAIKNFLYVINIFHYDFYNGNHNNGFKREIDHLLSDSEVERNPFANYLKNTNYIIEDRTTAILMSAVLNKNIEFLKILSTNFLLSFNVCWNKVSLLDLSASKYDPEICKYIIAELQKQGRSVQNELQKNTPEYINFLSYPLLQSNLDTKKYLQLIKAVNMDGIPKVNKFDCSQLHTICQLIDRDFDLYFPIFKHFVLNERATPFLKNKFNKTPIDLINNQVNRYTVLLFLQKHEIEKEETERLIKECEQQIIGSQKDGFSIHGFEERIKSMFLDRISDLDEE